MQKEHKYAITKFENAFLRLKEAAEAAQDELEKDGTIQRFEFTFELMWKTLRIALQDSGINVKTPKESLQEAFRLGWLKNEEIFLNMLEDRNKTSHIYDKNTADEIFERICKSYVSAIGEIFDVLKRKLS